MVAVSLPGDLAVHSEVASMRAVVIVRAARTAPPGTATASSPAHVGSMVAKLAVTTAAQRAPIQGHDPYRGRDQNDRTHHPLENHRGRPGVAQGNGHGAQRQTPPKRRERPWNSAMAR